MSPYVVTCWLRSETMRSSISRIAPAESRADGLKQGHAWMRENADLRPYWSYADDVEVGFKVEQRR